MTSIEFTTMTDLSLKEELVSMMRALDVEDEADGPVDSSRFGANIEFLLAHPSCGRIILFSDAGALVGYALLVPYWSNEFGGTLLFVDEMFVVAAARSKGIGRSFFGFLEAAKPFDAVALALEVSRGNSRAHRLYESLGFNQRRNAVLTRRFAQSSRDKDV